MENIRNIRVSSFQYTHRRKSVSVWTGTTPIVKGCTLSKAECIHRNTDGKNPTQVRGNFKEQLEKKKQT